MLRENKKLLNMADSAEKRGNEGDAAIKGHQGSGSSKIVINKPRMMGKHTSRNRKSSRKMSKERSRKSRDRQDTDLVEIVRHFQEDLLLPTTVTSK